MVRVYAFYYNMLSHWSAVDCGDYVVVTNARQIAVTGKKADQVVYRRHTMFPGGLKEVKYKDMMNKKPDEVRSPFTQLFSRLIVVPYRAC